MTAIWILETRRNGGWVQLDRFFDRDAACKALGAVLRDFGCDDVRLRRERSDLPELMTRKAAA